MLGEFLEISLSTPDILASVQFYECLGFQHAQVGETWKHPYAVLTDGHVHLGLHQYDFPSPALTFVLPDLRVRLPQLQALGIRFEFCRISGDEFNEAGFYAPEGQMIALLEARTYSPLELPPGGGSLCGYFCEYRLPVHAVPVSRDFWEQLGFIATDDRAAAQAHSVRLSSRGLNVGLWENSRQHQPQLVFVREQPEQLATLLEQRKLAIRRGHDDVGGAELLLTAPESTRLLIRGEDF